MTADAHAHRRPGDAFGIQPVEHLSKAIVLGADKAAGRYADIIEVQRELLLRDGDAPGRRCLIKPGASVGTRNNERLSGADLATTISAAASSTPEM
jgi:hypothetical protein